jgi:phospholipase/carboxylesterase
MLRDVDRGPDAHIAEFVPLADAGWLYTPPTRRADSPAPLVVLLHGAGGSPRAVISLLQPVADDAGVIVAAPRSAQRTWLPIALSTWPDASAVKLVTRLCCERFAIDPAHMALGGFSDGATFALTFGLSTRHRFSHVIAFSPGYLYAPIEASAPRFFVSHGSRDEVLPADRCGRNIARRLQAARYDVTYREFDGGHEVPADIGRAALQWFVK